MNRDELRGQILNREFGSQIRDFKGLRWGNITPTDLDIFIEFKNVLFVLAELKYGEAHLPYGQKLALERITDSLQKTGESFLFVCKHDNRPPKDIIASESIVSSFYWRKEWHNPKTVKTLFEATNILYGKYVEEVAL